MTIVQQLDAVHAVFEGWSVRIAERFIEAQHVRKVADCFGLAARFSLPEVLFREYRLYALNEIFSAQQKHAGLFLGGDDRHEASARQEKRPEPVPVARLAN